MANSIPQCSVAQAIGLTTSAFLAGMELPVFCRPTSLAFLDGKCMLTVGVGAIISVSYLCIPSVQLAPDPLSARQWKALFSKGKGSAPPVAMLTAAVFGYLAYKFYDVPLSANITRGQLYALAVVAAISNIPYTLIVMQDVNGKLLAKCADAEGLNIKEKATQVGLPKGETTTDLLNRWKFYNMIRGLLSLSAAALGMWATLA